MCCAVLWCAASSCPIAALTSASVQVEVRAVAEAACHRLVDAQQLRRVPEQRLVRLHPAEELLALHRLQTA